MTFVERIIDKYTMGASQYKFVYDKKVQEIKNKISTITDDFYEYEMEFGQDKYTEELQRKQYLLTKQLDKLLNE